MLAADRILRGQHKIHGLLQHKLLLIPFHEQNDMHFWPKIKLLRLYFGQRIQPQLPDLPLARSHQRVQSVRGDRTVRIDSVEHQQRQLFDEGVGSDQSLGRYRRQQSGT